MTMEIAFIVFGVVVSIIGWLLADKDRKQALEITTAFRLIHQLEKDLNDFKLKVAENHYPKHELDKRFEQLNDTINKGFSSLSVDMKDMVKAMNAHFNEHHSGDRQ